MFAATTLSKPFARETPEMRGPRVTIGVPVYNGARYLEPCLDSLLAQTYEDIEIVISDNASTDRTPEICRAYRERDERVRYHRHSHNIGAAANFNYLPRHTRGELFKWAAHDDWCAPEFVERCVAALDQSPGDVLAFPRTIFVDAMGETLSKYDTDMRWRNHPTAIGRLDDLLGDRVETLLHKCTPQFGVIRRSALERTALMGAYNSSDLVLLVELALLGGFAQLDDYLFFSRVHEGSSLNANSTTLELAKWYDPTRGDHHPMVWARVLAGFVSVVGQSSLSLHDKLRAEAMLARWFRSDNRWRVIGGEVKRRLRERVQVRRALDRAM
jgi:glycosyltransferase involved in cell wall biosynthesis